MNEKQSSIWSEYHADIATQRDDGDFERICRKWCKRPEDFQFIKKHEMEEEFN